MFNDIVRYGTPIEKFDFPVKDIIDKIYIGPQAELLETLDKFNRSYGTNLKVNKSFNLKPGSYDDIKKAYGQYVLRWDMKPRGLGSITKRIEQYKWRSNAFHRSIDDVNRIISNLKRGGIGWIDNSDDIEQEYTRLSKEIESDVEKAKELYPNVDIEIYIAPFKSGNNYDGSYPAAQFSRLASMEDDISDFYLIVKMYIKNPTITIHTVNSDEKVSQYEITCGDILIYTGISLLKILSKVWGNEGSTFRLTASKDVGFNIVAAYLSPMSVGAHPYISYTSDKYRYELQEGYLNNVHSNICRGNMQTEIQSTLINGHILAHVTQIHNWLSHYFIPQTYPLNNISRVKERSAHKVIIELSKAGSISYDPIELFHQCFFPEDLYRSISSYGVHGQESGVRLRDEIVMSMYGDNVETYVSHIKFEDFPCHECELQEECDYFSIYEDIYGENEMNEELEAIYGMLYEKTEFSGIRSGESSKEYIELIKLYDFYDMLDAILIVNNSYQLYLFHSILKLIFNKEDIEYVNIISGGSDIAWDRFKILYSYIDVPVLEDILYDLQQRKEDGKEYNVEAFFDLLKKTQKKSTSADTSSRDEDHNLSITAGSTLNLNSSTTRNTLSNEARRILEDLPSEFLTVNLESTEEDESLTDSERTLRWATQMGGGSQNL